MDTSHPRFVLDHNRCILCTRCVRVCAEIEGAHVWDMMSRGVDSRLVSELNSRGARRSVLHQLRQVRAGLPHRRAGRKGLSGGGDDQTRQRRVSRLADAGREL